MLCGRYEPEVVSELLSMVDGQMIAYDIGAHIGFMTLVLAEGLVNGKVFAFEPVEENLHFLEELITGNDLSRCVVVVPAALGNTNTIQRIVIFKSPAMNLLESAVDGQDTNGCPQRKVNTLTLDQFVFDQGNATPGLLKIDVEGAEALVLEGGLRTLEVYSPKIIIEIHGPRNAQKTWRLLDPLNYRWSHLCRGGRKGVVKEENLLSLFSKDSWVHHFLLIREVKSS
jgi:FkbM family methyltransferase